MSLAETESAFQAGYAAADERQTFYTSRPGEGVRWPSDDFSWHSPPASPVPKGLGYLLPPEPIPVYVADAPGLVPQILPLPVPDGDLMPASLTGSVHGWRPVIYADAGPVMSARADRPRRRGRLARLLLGRGA